MSKALARNDQLTNTFTIIKPPDDDIRAINYYRDELEATLNRFEAFKEKTNMIIERGKQQEYLLEFRKMLSGRCILTSSMVTIIHCTNKIKRNDCNFHTQCGIRKSILDLINI